MTGRPCPLACWAATLFLATSCTSGGEAAHPQTGTVLAQLPVTAAPTRPPAAAFPAYSVTARVPLVVVHSEPAGPVLTRLANPRPSGAVLTFLLDRRQGGWLKVFLPVRPNGSEGWISAAEATVRGDPYRLDVHVDLHRLDLFAYGKLLRHFPVGVGRTATPTPGGTFYLAELLRPPNPGGPYGPFAYGLSGHSTTLQSFAGSDAVIGLHGTDDPASVGRDVSHGCIRLHNSDITYLAGLLPLGTPVRILH